MILTSVLQRKPEKSYIKFAFETGSFHLFGYRFDDYMKLPCEMKFGAVKLWFEKRNL